MYASLNKAHTKDITSCSLPSHDGDHHTWNVCNRAQLIFIGVEGHITVCPVIVLILCSFFRLDSPLPWHSVRNNNRSLDFSAEDLLWHNGTITLTETEMDTSGGSRIFPSGVRQLPNLDYFVNFLPKTGWKWKNLDPPGGARVPGAPLRSANGYRDR